MKRPAVVHRGVAGALRRKPAAPRSLLVSFCRTMSSTALSPGRSGNLSVRTGDGMLITPTGMAYDEIETSDIVHVLNDGTVPAGQRAPSSEWHMHLAIYAARADAGAIVHTHSLNATALSCLHKGIPAFHYMVAEFGGDHVACAPYATYGSELLARHAVKALGAQHACLLANHGAITVAADLSRAFERARDLEALAAQYLLALRSGSPQILSKKDMAKVLEKFRTYGQQPETGQGT